LGTKLEGRGLAMSISFGDEIGHDIGIVVDPEILEHFFDKVDKFIILGSDGILEFISTEEVVDIVKKYYLENIIEGAIEHLYNESSKRLLDVDYFNGKNASPKVPDLDKKIKKYGKYTR